MIALLSPIRDKRGGIGYRFLGNISNSEISALRHEDDSVVGSRQTSPLLTPFFPTEWRLHFRLGLFKVMSLRDKDWAQVVKTNHYP
jgi:hypothetical protein